MPTATFDAKGLIQSLQARGWRWVGMDGDLLMHPTNREFFLRYDAPTGRLTVSPQLDAHLDLIIPTPAGKSKVFR